MTKTSWAFVAITMIALLAYFGIKTKAPCVILRERVRAQQGIPSFMPDALVEAYMYRELGPLTPDRCTKALFTGRLR